LCSRLPVIFASVSFPICTRDHDSYSVSPVDTIYVKGKQTSMEGSMDCQPAVSF
jgi:hypothetical protein